MFDVEWCEDFEEMYEDVKDNIGTQKEVDLLVCKYNINSLKIARRGYKIYRGIKFNFYIGKDDENGQYQTFTEFFNSNNNRDLFIEYQYAVFVNKNDMKAVGVMKNPFIDENAFFEFENENVDLEYLYFDKNLAVHILLNSYFFQEEFTNERIEKLSLAFESLKNDGYEFDFDYISLLQDEKSLFLLKKMNQHCMNISDIDDVNLIFILIEARYNQLNGIYQN